MWKITFDRGQLVPYGRWASEDGMNWRPWTAADQLKFAKAIVRGYFEKVKSFTRETSK